MCCFSCSRFLNIKCSNGFLSISVAVFCAGVVDYCEHYADGAYNVCKTLIPPPIQYDVQTARKVQEELEVNIPLSRIADRRRWRDDRLSALTTLKRQCDEADRGGN